MERLRAEVDSAHKSERTGKGSGRRKEQAEEAATKSKLENMATLVRFDGARTRPPLLLFVIALILACPARGAVVRPTIFSDLNSSSSSSSSSSAPTGAELAPSPQASSEPKQQQPSNSPLPAQQGKLTFRPALSIR